MPFKNKDPNDSMMQTNPLIPSGVEGVQTEPTMREAELARLMQENPEAAAMHLKHKSQTSKAKDRRQDHRIETINKRIKHTQQSAGELQSKLEAEIKSLHERLASVESQQLIDRKFVKWFVTGMGVLWAAMVFAIPLAWDIYKHYSK